MRLNFCLGVALFAASLGLGNGLAFPELGKSGFGASKLTVSLNRKLPATFALAGTEVSVRTSSTLPTAAAFTQTLGALVETTLQENDHRIVIENTKPQTSITCIITGFIPAHVQTLTKTVNASDGNIFTTKTKQQAYHRLSGEIQVSFRAVDVKSRKTLDAAVLRNKVSEDYEVNGSKAEDSSTIPKFTFGRKEKTADVMPATPDETNQAMLHEIATQVARRIVNTDDKVDVLLARGKLEHASKLGQSGLWPHMLEEVEGMPAFSKPEDDSYRLYDLGVAYEAMGYGASDPKQSFKFFEQAAINYGKALDTNPNEKYFREPQNRIQTALTIMKTLSDRASGIAPPNGTGDVPVVTAENPQPEPPSKPPSSPGQDSDTLTNDAVIELAKSGMNDENLIANIKESKQVSFNLSLSGQKQLMQGGVSNAVLSAMRQRANAIGSAPKSTGTAKVSSKGTQHP